MEEEGQQQQQQQQHGARHTADNEKHVNVAAAAAVAVEDKQQVIENDRSSELDPSILEGGASSSRSSVRLINEVVSKFDSVKRELVRSTGFDTILQFPVLKQFNRKFSMWLMSCVNEHTSCLSIGDHIKIRFNKNDVAHVFGIPASGKTILDVRHSSREAKEKVLNDLLPSDFKEVRSIKVLQEVIERQYDHPMSKVESDRFRVAFVVFVASILLAPSAKYDYACVDYWNAIQDADEIGSYDWSDYVVVRLLEGVTKLKQDFSSNIKFPNITGCSLFLQVLYLDSIEIEGLSKPHSRFPRIIDFSHEFIRKMIQADGNYERFVKGHYETPIRNLRDPFKCIYSWAFDCLSRNDSASDGCFYAIWEAAVAMVHLLEIPLESAGPIFVAAADFEEQINSGVLVSGVHAIKFMSVLVSIMIPYRRGFSYQSSFCVESRNLGFDVVETAIVNGTRSLALPMRIRRRQLDANSLGNHALRNKQQDKFSFGGACDAVALSNGSSTMLEHEDTGQLTCAAARPVIASMDDIPHKLNINHRVATAMAQFYSVIRMIKPALGFDLNSCSHDESMCAQPTTTLVLDEPDAIPSPWALGFEWVVAHAVSDGGCALLNSMEADDRLAIVHNKPKYIQVTMRALCAQIRGQYEFELDLVDALVRCIIQQDDVIYASYTPHRWRHFFESDFMEAITTGSFDLVDSNLPNFLRMNKSNYDMAKSKLVFFPAMLQCSWVCFTWNLESNELFVFEPRYLSPVPDFRVQAIERAAYLLKIGLLTLSRSYFHGVCVDPTTAVLRIVTIPVIVGNRSNRSGVLCMYFCRCFDGYDMKPKLDMVEADVLASKLLMNLARLKFNEGLLPSILHEDL